MKNKILLTALFCLVGFVTLRASEIRYVGGDISLLPTYQQAGVIYNDNDGKQIELLPYLHEIGMNAMRVRLFVNPSDSTVVDGKKVEDTNVCQDLPYIIPLCKDIVSNGFDLMLDFHYSDTWADPGKQFIPDAWKDLNDEELVAKIYDYTKSSLEELKKNGIVPKFIQPGNEISYGMLWSAYGEKDDNSNHVWKDSSKESWARFGSLLNSAIKACKEVCPDVEIIIHTERVAQVDVLKNFYSQMAQLDIDYDIIGLSYYPSYHGQLAMLDDALNTLEKEFSDKPIMIVETGYPLYWDLPGKDNYPLEYPGGNEQAQNNYAKDLVALLLSHSNVNGLFWWWLDYNPYGAGLQNWWNAPLFDPYTGKATSALKTIASFGSSNAATGSIESETGESNELWYDMNGNSYTTPSHDGVFIHKGKKYMIKK